MASELSLLQSQLVQLRATINSLQLTINETEQAIVEGELALQTLHANTLAAERALSNPNLTTGFILRSNLRRFCCSFFHSNVKSG